MHTDDLILFNQLLEHTSISATARAMQIPLPTVSRRLRALESRFNVQLFKRTSNRLLLTEEGHIFNQCAQRMLQEMDSMQRELNQIGEQGGRVTIAAPNGIHIILSQQLQQFYADHPDIKLNFITYEGVRASQDIAADADLVIRVGQPIENAMLCRRLFGVYRSFVASPTFIQQHPDLCHPSQLEHFPAVLSSKGGMDLNTWYWCDQEGRHSVKVNGPSTDLVSMNVEMVEQGLGAGWLAVPLCDESLRSGRLQMLFDGKFGTLFDIYLLYTSRRHLPQRVRLVIDFLVEKSAMHDCVKRCDQSANKGCSGCLLLSEQHAV